MKLILCLVFLPILCAAKVQNIACPDGKECPFGKTCCDSSNGVFQCCDLPEDERQNKKLIPAVISHSTSNMSYSPSDGVNSAYSFCTKTQCGAYCCNYYNGVCCPNPYYCCDSGLRCCSNNYAERPWCCRKRDRCSTSYNYCLAGASSVSVAILSLLSAFAFATTSKYFL